MNLAPESPSRRPAMEQPVLTDDSPPTATRVVPSWRRPVYIALGGFFVLLGFVGAFLPIVPTTPFLLLASFFFVRSSPALNRRLLRSRLFGPFLRDWQRHRAVTRRVKATALVVMPVAVFCGAYFGDLSLPLVALLGVLALIGTIVVLRLPVIRKQDGDST